MHSSQNEQDSRYLADFANVPCLEPATVAEAYDDSYRTYDLSEQLKVPVTLQLVTRVAHCRGPIARAPRLPVRSIGLPHADGSRGWALLPALLPQTARRQYQKLCDKIPEMRHQMEAYDRLVPGRNRTGVVVAGLGRALFEELDREAPLDAVRLQISGYPISQNLFDICLRWGRHRSRSRPIRVARHEPARRLGPRVPHDRPVPREHPRHHGGHEQCPARDEPLRGLPARGLAASGDVCLPRPLYRAANPPPHRGRLDARSPQTQGVPPVRRGRRDAFTASHPTCAKEIRA